MVSFFIGAVAGIVVALVAVEFGLKKMFAPPETTKLTSLWSFREFGRPLVASLDATSAAMPRTAKLVTPGAVPAPSSGIESRVTGEVKGDFVVDAEQERAVLALGGLGPGSLALVTVDPKLVGAARAEFHRLWGAGREHVSKVKVADIALRDQQVVETRGTVADIVPSGERWLARLQDGAAAVGVRVAEPLDRGAVVTVTGRVVRGPAGAPLIDAHAVAR